MARRRFLVQTASLVAAPLVARAQAPSAKIARIGYVSLRSGPSHLEDAFRQGLRELGYVDGQNVSIDYRWGDLKSDRVTAHAVDLTRLKVDVIVSTGGDEAAVAVTRTVTTIPVVVMSGDLQDGWPRRRPGPARRQRHRDQPARP
jgi:putative tryptophan/tyrosine transport system substrate-binding protein